MIKLLVIGHLGRDAHINEANGKTVINFNVAHTEKYKDAQGNEREKTTWVACSWWTERINIVPYLKKGVQVYAEGIPESRHYTTREGNPASNLTLRVNMVQLLSSRKEGQPGDQQTDAINPSHTPSDIPQDGGDLPF